MLAQVAADPGSTLSSLGAFLITCPRDKIRTVLLIGWFARTTFVPAALLIGFCFLTQLVSLGLVSDLQSGGVAYMAHIGGMVFGAITARLFEYPRHLPRQWDEG